MRSIRPSERSVKPRAAVYCRVSTPGQEAEGTSLETQEAACRQYALDHGYRLDPEHIFREVLAHLVHAHELVAEQLNHSLSLYSR